MLYRKTLHFPGRGSSQLLDIDLVGILGLGGRRLVGMVQGVDHGAKFVAIEIDER